MQTTTVSSICPLCKGAFGSAANSALPSRLCEECRAMLATILPQAASGSTIIVDAKPQTAELQAQYAASRDAEASNPFGFQFDTSPAPVASAPPPTPEPPANDFAFAPPAETPTPPVVSGFDSYEPPQQTASGYEAFDTEVRIETPVAQATVEPSLPAGENHYADFYFQSDDKPADAPLVNGSKTADVALPVATVDTPSASNSFAFDSQPAYEAEAFAPQPPAPSMSFDVPQTPESAFWQSEDKRQPSTFDSDFSQPAYDNSNSQPAYDNAFAESPYADNFSAAAPPVSDYLTTAKPEAQAQNESFSFTPPPQPLAQENWQSPNAEPQVYPPVQETPAPGYDWPVQEPPARFYPPLAEASAPQSFAPPSASLAQPPVAAFPTPDNLSPYPSEPTYQTAAPITDHLADQWDGTMDHYPVLMVQEEKRPMSKGLLLALAAVVLLALVAAAGYFLVYQPYFGSKPAPPTQRAGTTNEENRPTAPPVKPQESAPAATPAQTPESAASTSATTPATITPDTQPTTPTESQPAAETPVGQGKVSLQAASFPNEQAAKEFSEKLIRSGIPAYIVAADLGGKGRWYRVRVGRFLNSTDAEKYAAQARQRAQATGVNLQLVVCAYDNP